MAQDAERRVAVVTGASRGIGRACAVYLARAGFDLVLTARTVDEGEEREHSPTVRSSDTRPVPGSLRTTASLVAEEGGDSLVVPADLADPDSMAAVGSRALERWGAVDVVVHNARYVGPGHMDRFLDTPPELLVAQLTANVLGPLALTRALLPRMLARGSGAVVNITSSVAYVDPALPAGDGGWSMGYGITKAALHRVNGILAAEHAGSGVHFFNVQPGVIDTERGTLEAGAFGFGGWGAPPEVVGAVVAWLVSDPQDPDDRGPDPRGPDHRGATVEAQFLCHQLGLLPGWPGPRPNRAQVRYDESATQLRLLEEQLAQPVRP